MSRLQRLAPLVFCLTLGSVLSILLGQDASWDLRNYHLYNPFATLHDRFSVDFFAADQQTTFNPALDFPYMFLALGPLAHYPRLLAAFMGLPYGLMVFVVWHLCVLLFTNHEPREKALLAGLATLTSVTGAMAVTLAGSVSNDVTIGTLVLSGLLLVLRGCERAKAWVGGGFLFGLAAGFKLTATLYAPALVLAFLVTMPLRRSLHRSVIFALGWLVGFLLSYGWHGWELWSLYGNPTFPLFNGIFHSVNGPQDNLLYLRYLPQNIEQWVAYPFYWAFDSSSHVVFDVDLRDPRIALAYTAVILFGLTKLTSLFTKQKILVFPPLDERQGITIFFLIFSYFFWLVSSSLLRFAIPIETLSGLVVIRLATMAFGKNVRAVYATTILISAVCLLSTKHPVWERRDFKETMFQVQIPDLKPDTLFLGFGTPMAYLAAFTPPEDHDRFVGLFFVKYLEGTPLGDTGKQMIRDHTGPYRVLFEFQTNEIKKIQAPDKFGLRLPYLADFGLLPEVKNCIPVHDDLRSPENQSVFICDASKATSHLPSGNHPDTHKQYE